MDTTGETRGVEECPLLAAHRRGGDGRPWRTGVRAVALLLLLAPLAADAQTARGRLLRGLEFASGGREIHVRMGVPVRYVRHAPAGASDRFEVELTPLAQDRVDLLSERGDEALRAPAAAGSPLREVRYQGGRRREARLELRFTETVRIDVRQGSDLRSLVVTVEKRRPRRKPAPSPEPAPVPAPVAPEPEPPAMTATPDAPDALRHPYAIQLHAGPAAEPLPDVPDGLFSAGLQLYEVPLERDGEAWRRLRVGFFADEAEAQAMRDRVATTFHDAWVVRATPEERGAAPRAKTHAERATPRADGVGDRQAAPRAAAPETREAAAREDTAEILPAPSPPVPAAPLPAEDAELVARLLGEGHDALAAGEQERAVQLFTKVLAFPENPSTPEALEWLGLARERKGQLAHAQAEYQAYLERYPEGEGAVRVRQRLDALLTARSEPTPALRPAATTRRASDFDVFGSVATAYRRDEREARGLGDFLVDSAFFSDVFVGSRWQSERWDVRGEMSGTHLYDFIDDDTDWRANTLFLEALGRGQPWGFGVGRLPGNRAGVIGRMDGVRLSYELQPGWRLGSVAGFPVDPFLQSTPDTDRQLFGLSLETLELVEGVDVELFAIQQWAEGLTDRSAVGAELRYAAEGRFLAGLFDYDLHFGALNTAFLIGNLQLRPDTDLNVLLDWRRLPTLETRNALLGQPDDSLDDLRDRLGVGDLESLAEDRTARSRSASLGLTHRLNERFQVSGDLTLSDLSGTPASGGIEAFEGTGRQLSSYLQVTGTELLLAGDVGTLGLRWVDAREIDVVGLLWSWRSPLWRRFRLNPLLDLEWRSPDRGGRVFTVRPGLRVDMTLGRLTLDAEGHYIWSDGARFPGVEDEQGYTLLLGVRYDY